jgi:hypothetical protein
MLLCLSLALAACGDDPTAVCKSNLNWRAASTGTIACKGASGCACDTQSVCCVQVAGDPPAFSDGACTTLTSCPGLAFRCDGPEDCSAGTVCCAELNAGGGSSCKAETDCHGIHTTVLCRSDDDCFSKVKDCKPAEPGSFFDGVVGYCD